MMVPVIAVVAALLVFELVRWQMRAESRRLRQINRIGKTGQLK